LKPRHYAWLALTLVAVILGYPFESTVVPAWRLRAVDERGDPYVGKQVRQAWKHYSLELDAGENMEDQFTDGNGYVTFPERSIRTPLLWRAVLTTVRAALTVAHGGYGIHADVAATGPRGYKSVTYDPNKPPPDLIVLPPKE
jgi:hypothetical protein